MRYLDIYGKEFSFKVDGKTKITSNTGVFLSIMTAITIAVVFYGFGINFFFKLQPRISSSVVPNNGTMYKLKNNQLQVPFRIRTNMNSSTMWTDLITVWPVWWGLNKTGGGTAQTMKDIPIKTCSELNLDLPEFTDLYDPTLWNCLDYEAIDMAIGGGDNFIQKHWLGIMWFCSTNGSWICEEDKLEQLMFDTEGLYIDVLYPSTYFVGDNLTHPFQFVYSLSSWQTNKLTFKWTKHKGSLDVAVDDQGWLFSEYTYDYKWNIAKTTE